MLCYVDDTILIDPNDKPIDNVIQELQRLNYDLTDEGDLEDYLRIRIERFKDGKLQMLLLHTSDEPGKGEWQG